ncbi:hypothetical protein ACWOBE_06820 [Hutsoniella sourekii]
MKLLQGKPAYYLAIGLFILTIALNYLSATGIIFPYNQAEISDYYANYLAPAGFTFSIWGLIYLGMTLSLALPAFGRLSTWEKQVYFQEVMPRYLPWLLANSLWIILWSYDWIALALLAILAYTYSLIRLIAYLDHVGPLRPLMHWSLVLPLGLHAGWLTFASYTNVMTLLVKWGLAGLSSTGALLTVLLMVLASLSVLAIFRRYHNPAVTLPALWALYGIFTKQMAGNQLVKWSALILGLLALAGHIWIYFKDKNIINNDLQ